MSEGSTQFRLSVVGIIVMVLFSALFARLWFLQVAESGNLASAATSNRIRVIHEPAIRGRILDVQGRPLVENRVVEAITYDASQRLPEDERTAMIGRLAELLGKTPEDIQKAIDDPRNSSYAPAAIETDVPMEVITYIREHQEEFPAVSAERLTIRGYPNGKTASHVVGYIGEINEEELEAREGDGYRLGDLIGKTGVEQMFESVLRGTPRTLRIEVDSRGRVVNVIEDQPAIPGNDVQLTIDIDIQKIAEESLAQGMEDARDYNYVEHDPETGQETGSEPFKATGGSVTVVNPNDGSIVAMASAPDYNPADLAEGVDPAVLEAYNEPESGFPLLNRAVGGTYAPGSTFKLISAIAGLGSGQITPDERVQDEGCLLVGDPPLEFCNAGKVEHGSVNLAEAITVSSDVYFYELGRDLWHFYNQWRLEGADSDLEIGYAVQDTARDYGFGNPTGLGLANEASGRVPDQEFKEDFNETNPDLQERRVNSLWLPGDSVILSVGQGDLLVTPIQLATAYATFVNGGTRYTPRLGAAVLEPGTGNESAPPETIRELPAQPSGEIELDPNMRDALMVGLIGAVCNGEGTAVGAFTGYGCGPAAGKTGTAEVSGKQDNSLFVGISNPGEPQYVTVAIVEQAGFGSAVAAPIARRVMDALAGETELSPVRVQPPNNQAE